MKVFDNREGFLGLFNRSAEIRIYSDVSNPAGTAEHILENGRPVPPLSFLNRHGLLDDKILYADVLNEFPCSHGYDWIKTELNKRSKYKQAVRIFEFQRFGRQESIIFKNRMPMKKNKMYK
jgi:hypothetical protein